MITEGQKNYIYESAYLPEHMVHYVISVSESEPFLFGDFLAYFGKGRFVFIGYPLQEAFELGRMKKALDEGVSHFNPEEVSLIAPVLPSPYDCGRVSKDHYYRLELSSLTLSQKLRNMLKRAGRDLRVEKTRRLDNEHHQMMKEFLELHLLDEATQSILKRIPEYLSSASTAWIFNARDTGGGLVAFDIVEFGAGSYSLYMFNFISRDRYIPGASDLLLYEMLRSSGEEKKKFINLGLGINPGITFFKKKWGGLAFLPYAFCLYRPSKKENLETLLQKL
jgi:hypothetical protein